MGAKTFKTLDEQIDILKNRGLIISDVEKAKNNEITETDIWGIISDVSESENDWSWVNDTGTFRQ